MIVTDTGPGIPADALDRVFEPSSGWPVTSIPRVEGTAWGWRSAGSWSRSSMARSPVLSHRTRVPRSRPISLATRSANGPGARGPAIGNDQSGLENPRFQDGQVGEKADDAFAFQVGIIQILS